MVAGLRSGANGLRAALRGLTGARGACWHRGTSHREGSCRWAMGGTAPAWGSFLQRLRVLRCSSTAGREEQCPQGVVLPGFGAGGQAACCWWAAAQPGSCCETLRSFFSPSWSSRQHSPGSSRSTARSDPGWSRSWRWLLSWWLPDSRQPGPWSGIKNTNWPPDRGFDVAHVNLNVGGQLCWCDFS